MEILIAQASAFDLSVAQWASNQLIGLIRKLRWIGMDDEAEQLLAKLMFTHFRPTEPLVAEPSATD
ncbi:MAG TPA: hypothetical protein VGJ20_44415 [Xanthobacteraceae bacterium]|jgi:hypothetical protein